MDNGFVGRFWNKCFGTVSQQDIENPTLRLEGNVPGLRNAGIGYGTWHNRSIIGAPPNKLRAI